MTTKTTTLRATATCEAPSYVCGYRAEFKTLREAVTAAAKHNRETNHYTRAEQIRTVLFAPREDTA